MLKLQKYIRKIYFRNKTRIINDYRILKANQSLSLSELNHRQLVRLNNLLDHTYHHVPYYRELFSKNGLVINGRIQLQSLAELAQIPFLTKDIIRDTGENLRADDHVTRKSFINSSGGSTGQPVVMRQDEAYTIADTANLLLLKDWRGVDPFDSEIFIWGAERDTFGGKKPLSMRIADFLRNRIILSSFRMTDSDKREFIELLNHHRPAMIRTYADSIYELARFIREHNLRIAPQHLIHTAASNLHDFMRRDIEQVFQCPVFNHYGGREVGAIASECPAHDGLHIMMEHNLLEVVGPDGQPCRSGDEGEIVVTNLNNYSTPLIRYRIGDLGIMKEYEPCPCGCNYPRLQKVIGRVTDVFKNSKGHTIFPEYFIRLIRLLNHNGGIRKFQFIQNDRNRITVKIKSSGAISRLTLDEITGKIRLAMGDDCQVDFDFVDQIEATASGKYRFTISEYDESETLR
nr:phenylacetate--CoA ligase family protein [candidate division Zixibacteria bacterium]